MEENNWLCKKCGYNPIDRSESKYSILCTSCRDEHKKYPIPKLLIVGISIVLAIVLILSFTILPKSIKEYRVYNSSYSEICEGNYQVLMDNKDDLNIEVAKAAEIYVDAMNRGQYEFAMELFNKYLADKKVSDAVYNVIMAVDNDMVIYCDTVDYIMNIQNSIPQDTSMEEFYNLYKAEINNMIESNNYNTGVCYYYLGLLTEDSQEAKGYYEKAIENDDNFQDSRVELANIYRREGDISTAESMYNDALSIDSRNAGALRGLSIIKLLSNDTKEAVTFAKEAYKCNRNAYYVYETLIIALTKNGQAKEAEKYIKEYEELGGTLEEDTQQLLDDQMSLEDYYLYEKGENL